MSINKDLNQLHTKTVLITGAGSGIGQAAAILFSQLGAGLILVDRDKNGLQATRAKCPGSVELYTVDLSIKDEITKFWKRLPATPDVIINNVGIYPFIKFDKLTEQDLSKVMDINLNSVFWMCQEFIKRKHKNGVIVNVSSIEAAIPFKKDMAHYSVSKAGVSALTRSLAHDYGPKGFRVNAVMPGGVITPTTKKLGISAILHFNLSVLKTGYDYRVRLPMKRFGKPEEIAKVMVFLAGDMSSYVTGAILNVDGGFLSA